MADTQPIADPVAGLIDIPLPLAVSLWPMTWPARIAVVLLLAGAIVGVWQWLRHRHANRYRREALAELKRIAQAPTEMAAQQVAAELSLLVRRTTLAAFPRQQVAPLAGKTWLVFLDHSLGGTEFTEGAGRLLASAPYAPTPLRAGQLAELVELTGRWIRGHHV